MSLLLRCGLIAIAVVAAFAGGFFLKSHLSLASVAAEPPVVANVGPKSSHTTTAVRTVERISAKTTVPANRTFPATVDGILLPPAPVTPRHDDVPPIVALPPADTRPAPPPAIPDPSDPAFQMIKNEWKINTTVVDKSTPLPAVVAEAKRNGLSIPDKNSSPAPSPSPAIKLINNRSIELDFEVTKTGRSKIRSVELWATRDGGGTWQKMDQMMGSESPFCTRLASEGTYGFRLAFLSESGMRTHEPMRGSPPDVSLILDTSPPAIALFPPEVWGEKPGQVRLSWSMTDAHLDKSSVRIDYSVDGKVWKPIENIIPYWNDKGGYCHDWTMPREVPPRVLLRVTARDKAGNVGTAQTNEKVAVDLVVPEGKIKGVRVAGAMPENGPAPRVVDDARQIFQFWTEWSRLP